MNIGQRIRKIRKSKGFSLRYVQERAGMHGSHLSRVETGHIVPSLETLERCARALDVEVYKFFLEEGQVLPPGAVQSPVKAARFIDSREERLLDRFRRMETRKQDLILSLAESVDRQMPKQRSQTPRRAKEELG